MIPNQKSPQTNYRILRSNYYNIPRSAEATDLDKPLEIYNPRPKLALIERSLKRLANNHFIGLQYVQDYLLSQYRRNRSINTIRASFDSIHQFLRFLKMSGRQRFKEITCDDLSAYIEYEQDQGKKPMTVHGRLRSLKAFFNYHIDRNNIDAAVLKRKLRIKLPQRQPRAIDQYDSRLVAVGPVCKSAKDR